MTKKAILKLLAVYVGLFLLGTVLYVLLLRFNLIGITKVFFFNGIVSIVLCGIIIAALMWFIRHKWMKDVIIIRDIILLFMCFCCINVVVFTHLPVTAERSVSVYMLGYMSSQSSDEIFTKEDIEQQFIDQFVYEYGAFDKRFDEQIAAGTIVEVEPGKYKITKSGKNLMRIYDWVTEVYGIDDKLVNPK